MYYLIAFAVYFVVLLVLLLLLKRPGRVDAKKGQQRFAEEMLKGLSKSDVKNRKKRVKVLPLRQRVLYWLWFGTTISFLLTVPLALGVSRIFVLPALYAPDNTVYFSSGGEASMILPFFTGLLLGAVPALAFSYATYTDTIQKADAIYQMGSFQTYPLKFNLMLSLIIVLVCGPFAILGYNSYHYCTESEVVTKPIFSFTEKAYPYSEIDYVELKPYEETFAYIAYTDGGKKIELYAGPGNQELLDILTANGLTPK